MSLIEENVSKVKERIKIAAEKSGRSINDITLVAVTKNRSLTEIAELKPLGIRSVGESRVQELALKFDVLRNDFDIHFIGHLQTNKVKEAVRMSKTIESVDSLRLLESINDACRQKGVIMPVLLQVNASQEGQKHGFSPESVASALEKAFACEQVSVRGLMTMAMLTEKEDTLRRVFGSLRGLRDDLQNKGYSLPELSMGMSGDFETAIEEGATRVRIGGALFERH